MTITMPTPVLQAAPTRRSVIEFLEFEEQARRDVQAGHLTPGTYVLGFRLPDWQRPAVWTTPQQQRFIESAWLGLHLGAVVVTRRNSLHLSRLDPLDLLLIDGQQRLRALARYLSGDLRVFGATWADLSPADHQRFLGETTLGFVQLDTTYTESKLKDLYVRMNYGGTPHAPEHRPQGGQA